MTRWQEQWMRLRDGRVDEGVEPVQLLAGSRVAASKSTTASNTPEVRIHVFTATRIASPSAL